MTVEPNNVEIVANNNEIHTFLAREGLALDPRAKDVEAIPLDMSWLKDQG